MYLQKKVVKIKHWEPVIVLVFVIIALSSSIIDPIITGGIVYEHEQYEISAVRGNELFLSGISSVNDIEKDNNGKIIVVGGKSSGQGVWFARIHPNITLEWQKDYSFSSGSGYSIFPTNDNGYIICGKYEDGTSYGVIIKTDSDGNQEWNISVNADMLSDIKQTIDGGYIFVGDYPSGVIDASIWKINGSGTIQWNKTWGASGFDQGQAVIQISDNGYIVLSTGNYWTPYRSGITKLDSSGNTLWEQGLGGELFDIINVSDGYILSGAFDNSFDAAILMKTDINGNHQWNKTYDLDRSERGYSVKQTEDNGYVIGGYFYNTNGTCCSNTQQDLLIIKTDSQGILEWNTSMSRVENGQDTCKGAIEIEEGKYVGACLSDGAWIVEVKEDPYAIEGCTKINISGNYHLTTNIINSGSEACIKIEISDVVLDGHGYTIDGIDMDNTIGVKVEKYLGESTYELLTNITIKNLIVTDWNEGIKTTKVIENQISNNTINENEYGIRLTSFNTNTIKDNNIFNNDYGIYLASSDSNIIQNNNISSNNNEGIYLDTSNSNTISGGEIDNNNGDYNNAGVYLTDSKDNTITGVYMHENIMGAIYLDNSPNTTIEWNNVNDNCGDEVQIYVYESDNATIKNNNVTEGSGLGIYVEDSSGSKILNNNISNNHYEGILIYGNEGRSGHTIKDNNVNQNAEDCYEDGCGGIYLMYEENCLIEGNNVSENGYNGISLSETLNSTIKNNKVNNNNHFGIRIASQDENNGANNTIQGNILINNSDAGIRIGTENNIITENTIAGDGTYTGLDFGENYGIYLYSNWIDLIENRFEGNEILGYNYGFYAEETENFTLNGNIHNNSYGIYLDNTGTEIAPTIRDTEIYDNCNGIYLESSTVNIENTNFENNSCGDGGLYIQDSHINLKNGDFLDNGEYGIYENNDGEPQSVYWTITKDIVCRNNDISIASGWIVPFGGTITIENCTIRIGGEEIEFDEGQQGFVEINLSVIGGGVNYTIKEITYDWDGVNDSDGSYEEDDDYEDIDLPWNFTFYDFEYDELDFDSNGNLWFDEYNDYDYEFDLTASLYPIISAWNLDLSSYYYGNYSYQIKNDRVVFQWLTETYDDEDYDILNLFEIVLYKNGNIKIDYNYFNCDSCDDSGSYYDEGVAPGDGETSTIFGDYFGTPMEGIYSAESEGKSYLYTRVIEQVEQTVGGEEQGFEAEIHTDSNFTGSLKVSFYNENPGGSGFSLTEIGKFVNISPSAPINVTWWILKLYYIDAEIIGFDESTLRIQYYNETSRTWTKYDSPRGGVNISGNYVWANVTHFSIFGVFGSPAPSPAPTTTGGGGGGRRYECNDRKDNDRDGLIDYPDDPGCENKYDNNETDIVEVVELEEEIEKVPVETLVEESKEEPVEIVEEKPKEVVKKIPIAKESIWSRILMGIIILGMLLIGGSVWFEKWSAAEQAREEMMPAIEKIMVSVRPYLSHGYTPKDIRKKLIKKGWDKETADYVYKELKRFKKTLN